MPPMLMHDPETDDAGVPPSGEEVRRAATALGAAADARTAELDEARQIPDDLYLDAAQAGLFRQLVPCELGGTGASPLEWFRTGVEMAGHEASFGWVVTQGAAEMGWIASGADDSWAREVLADPLATSASSSAGIGKLAIDGATARLSGSWGFDSGSPGATWIGGMAMVEGATTEGGGPVIRWGWVPADRAEVRDDWDASGLRGTGSHSVVIPEQDIPTAWTFAPEAPTTNERGAHRAMVGNGYWPIAASVAATQLGNARRALAEATRVVLVKAPMPTFAPLAGNAAVQRSLVEAEGLWAAAAASMERELDGMWAEASRTGELSTATRVALHRASLTANVVAVRVVDLACEVTGTTSVARHHVLSRCRRDAHALQSHITVNGAARECNAQVALGLIDSHVLV